MARLFDPKGDFAGTDIDRPRWLDANSPAYGPSLFGTRPVPLRSNLHAGPRWPAGFSVTMPFDAFVFVLVNGLALPALLSSYGSKQLRPDQSLKECRAIVDHSVHIFVYENSLGCAASNPLDLGRTETAFDTNLINFQRHLRCRPAIPSRSNVHINKRTPRHGCDDNENRPTRCRHRQNVRSHREV